MTTSNLSNPRRPSTAFNSHTSTYIKPASLGAPEEEKNTVENQGITHRPHCHIYRRVSTAEQADSGLGLDAQLFACELYATRQGYDVAGVYTDENISGAATLLERPGLTKLLEELRRGDVVLVAKRDRLGREVLFVQLLQADIERRGAWVESAAGEGNGDQPADRLMRNLIDSFSEYERDQIRARTKAALAVKASRSERVGAIPYGFRLLPDGVHIEPHPQEVKIKQLAKAIRASGRSFAKVGAELAELGYFSRNGKPFEASQIKRMVEK